LTQIKAIVGLIGLNCGTSGSVLMENARKVNDYEVISKTDSSDV
jgi:hypothetical protein